jgi:hypothetical protein
MLTRSKPWIAGPLVAAALLAGCTAKYQVNNLAGSDTAKLDRSQGVYVTVPQDGAYGARPYVGSGQIVAQSVAAAFSPMASRIHIADKQLTNAEAIEAAKAQGAGYLVVPTIAQWEQRATEWSGRPSRMAIRVTVLDVATGKQLTSTAIEGRSRIMSLTSTSPESLLRDPLAQYVRELY